MSNLQSYALDPLIVPLKICKCIWVIQLPPSRYVISVAKDNWKMIIDWVICIIGSDLICMCETPYLLPYTIMSSKWVTSLRIIWVFFVLFCFNIDSFNAVYKASANCMHLKRHLNQYTLPQLPWCRFSLDGQFDPLSQPVGKFELALNLIFSRVSLCFV